MLRNDPYCVACIGATRGIQAAFHFCLSGQWEQRSHMTPDERDTAVEKLYREYQGAMESLAAVQASLEEIAATSSITTEGGYLMYSPSGLRLLDTDYVREQVSQYHSNKQQKEALRKSLID